MKKYIVVVLASLMFTTNVSADTLEKVLCRHVYKIQKLALKAKKAGISREEVKTAIMKGAINSTSDLPAKIRLKLIDGSVKFVDAVYDYPVTEEVIEDIYRKECK